MKGFFKTHTMKIVVYGLGGLIIALLIFQAGIFIGYRKAAFSYHWDVNYRMSANDPHSVFAPFFRDNDTRNPHGTIGEIVSVNLPSIMVKDRNNAEEAVLIGTSTEIRLFRSLGTGADLKIGSGVIVIGNPDEHGRIMAGLVRILPAASSSMPMMYFNSPLNR